MAHLIPSTSVKFVRVSLFALVCVVTLACYVMLRRRIDPAHVPQPLSPDAALDADPSALTLEALQKSPHLIYRSARAGEFGQMVVAAIEDTENKRLVTPLRCERAHFDRRGGICMTYERDALDPHFRALLLDASLATYRVTSLAGYPSRTSLSRDGHYAALTVFTTGDSYDSDFSTRTMIIDRQSGSPLPDLEHFSVLKDNRLFKRVDFNFWGVTFTPDSRSFYATLGTKGTTYLVAGDVASRTLSVVRESVECPSLSPDGRFIAFKKRNQTGVSQLHVLDTGTWEESALPGEVRHIDDQVTWLDDSHVLYGVTTAGSPEQALNVWVASIAPSGDPPRRFIAGASSPAVVR